MHKLKLATKKVRRLEQADAASQRAQLCCELQEAWESRDHSMMWRLAWKLGGKGNGSKNFFNVPSPIRPRSSDRRSFRVVRMRRSRGKVATLRSIGIAERTTRNRSYSNEKNFCVASQKNLQKEKPAEPCRPGRSREKSGLWCSVHATPTSRKQTDRL